MQPVAGCVKEHEYMPEMVALGVVAVALRSCFFVFKALAVITNILAFSIVFGHPALTIAPTGV